MTSIILPGILPSTARIIALIGFGADLNIDAGGWGYTDVAADIYEGGPITITPMGKADEFTTAQPAGCTFMLNNPNGDYSKGPQSSHYPFVRENTPLDIGLTLDGFATFTRFFGYITSWEPVDEPSGKTGWVRVQAFGKTRQLIQGAETVTDLMARYHVRAGALAVWPFTDSHLSTQAANAVPNGAPLAAVAPVNFHVDNTGSAFATAQANFPAVESAALLGFPDAVGQDFLRATVSLPTNGQLHIDFWRAQTAAPDTSETQLFVFRLLDVTGVFSTIEVRARMSQVSPAVKPGWIVRLPGGAILDSGTGSPGSTINPVVDGLFHNVHVSLVQNGGNVDTKLYVDGTLVDSHTVSVATLPATLTEVHVGDTIVAGTSGTGGLDIQSVLAIYGGAATPSWTVGTQLYTGERATDRMIRLCAEENLHGLPIDVRAAIDSDMTMGPQKPNTLINLLRECEAADGGVLLDGLTQGLAYVPRTAKYGQAAALTLDASLFHLAPPLEPKDDDLTVRNLWTVGRRDGSTVVATDKTGPKGTDAIGFYRGTATDLVLDSDTRLADIGAWLVALGTVNEPYRYPVLNLDLSAIPGKAADWLATQIGNRIDITNLRSVSTRHPPGTISLILEGYSEVIAPHQWTVAANCTPLGPWNVYALDSNFPLAADGQSLNTGLAAGATTMSVQTAAGKPLLSTDVGDYPIYMDVGGWPIHITAVSGISSPQTCTIDAAPNTSLIPGGTIVTDWRSPVLGL